MIRILETKHENENENEKDLRNQSFKNGLKQSAGKYICGKQEKPGKRFL